MFFAGREHGLIDYVVLNSTFEVMLMRSTSVVTNLPYRTSATWRVGYLAKHETHSFAEAYQTA